MRIIQNKITLLIIITTLVSAILVAGIIVQTREAHRIVSETQAVSESNALRLTFEVNARLHDKLIKNLAGTDGLSPRVLLANNDPEQFRQLFETYPISFIVVTDASLIPIATFPEASAGILRALPTDPEAFRKFRSDGLITRYHEWINDTLTRIAVIDIPWYPGITEGPANGILFAGFPVSAEELSYQIQGNARLMKEPVALPLTKTISEGKVITQLPLFGWRNIPVASLWLEKPSEILKSLNDYRRYFIWFLIISVSVFILFIAVYLKRYYMWPLRMFTLAIKFNDPEYLKMVRYRDKDFASMQQMVMNVFSHERLLNDMIRRRNSENMNAFHAAILSQISDAVYATDHKGIITYWNRAAEAIYVVNEQDAIGKIADELIRSRWDDPQEEARQQRLFETDGMIRGRISQELPNGTWIRVDAGITRLLDCNGKLLGQLYVTRKTEAIPAM
ncbi:PAS domain S-box protein [Lentimicrobium sp.]|uniref:PAS domain S-box protein n=1 Tax=Lentimicrobium sp. TaxID=2034841 RepID=UPI002BFB9555|nr:PAS domain S-box protein [Lentimicrobium sp.]HPJ62012.1 PAS domain S-box protein [Lentimicrobium sp.]